jgi:trehalose-phosphatase
MSTEGKPNNGGGELAAAERLWLFLDYDGTLAPFAPSPGVIDPDEDLIRLIAHLASQRGRRRVVILSGRRLSDIRKLLPVPGVLMAGSYGVEIIDWDGEEVHLVDTTDDRPLLERVKQDWAALIEGQQGFYLEDKGVALALHGKDALDAQARRIILEAAQMARPLVEKGTFRVQGGFKFLEVAPVLADKGKAVIRLLERFPWPGAKIIYIGDDDKDEQAFQEVNQLGGRTIVVAKEPRSSAAQERLEDPKAVRKWLEEQISNS